METHRISDDMKTKMGLVKGLLLFDGGRGWHFIFLNLKISHFLWLLSPTRYVWACYLFTRHFSFSSWHLLRLHYRQGWQITKLWHRMHEEDYVMFVTFPPRSSQASRYPWILSSLSYHCGAQASRRPGWCKDPTPLWSEERIPGKNAV